MEQPTGLRGPPRDRACRRRGERARSRPARPHAVVVTPRSPAQVPRDRSAPRSTVRDHDPMIGSSAWPLHSTSRPPRPAPPARTPPSAARRA